MHLASKSFFLLATDVMKPMLKVALGFIMMDVLAVFNSILMLVLAMWSRVMAFSLKIS